jgi:hypothetical protein
MFTGEHLEVKLCSRLGILALEDARLAGQVLPTRPPLELAFPFPALWWVLLSVVLICISDVGVLVPGLGYY